MGAEGRPFTWTTARGPPKRRSQQEDLGADARRVGSDTQLWQTPASASSRPGAGPRAALQGWGGPARCPPAAEYLLVLLLVHCGPHEAEGPAAQGAQRAVLAGVGALAGGQPFQLHRPRGFREPRPAPERLQVRRAVCGAIRGRASREAAAAGVGTAALGPPVPLGTWAESQVASTRSQCVHTPPCT